MGASVDAAAPGWLGRAWCTLVINKNRDKKVLKTLLYQRKQLWILWV